jgi:hypothetical protein
MCLYKFIGFKVSIKVLKISKNIILIKIGNSQFEPFYFILILNFEDRYVFFQNIKGYFGTRIVILIYRKNKTTKERKR